MLTEDEIFLAIDNVPITQKYVVGVGRAIEATVLAKLAAGADARMPEQNGGSVQPYVNAGAPGATDAERAAWLADKIVALGDYAKEAAAMLRRWPAGVEVGDVVVTKNMAGQIVAVTRQDSEGRILKVIAEGAAGVMACEPRERAKPVKFRMQYGPGEVEYDSWTHGVMASDGSQPE